MNGIHVVVILFTLSGNAFSGSPPHPAMYDIRDFGAESAGRSCVRRLFRIRSINVRRMAEGPSYYLPEHG